MFNFPIEVLMVCREVVVRVRDINVCTDVLCARIFTEFQQLGVNETIGENFMFSVFDVRMNLLHPNNKRRESGENMSH